MKIGILGTRGIPNTYGGFEQFAQFLSAGLVQKGHEVFVYNSSLHPYRQSAWEGVNIIHCRDPENVLGALGQFLYDFNCFTDARKRGFGVLLQLGYTSNSMWHRRWPRGAINVVNMDGLEWKRSKYSNLTRKFLKKAEGWAVKYADHLISDSPAISDYLLSAYQRRSTYVPYGAEIFTSPDKTMVEKLALPATGYYLLIGRMEPENNQEMIISGFLNSRQDGPLVVVGNTGKKFGKYLRSTFRDDRIKFIGAIYEKEVLDNLRHFSKMYFHGHSVGGTNPSLLEAMACGCQIVAHENVFNRAVLADNAEYFSSAADVTELFKLAIDQEIVCQRREANIEKIRSTYNWEKVVADYEKLMLDLLSQRK